MPYNPSIDGLRAIAVLAVVVFHVVPGRLKGGFTGVDVFFVLSGFLITSIILEALRKAQFSLSEFYLRRALRLGPNLLVMLGCVIGVASWTALPGFSSQAAENMVWTLSCASNFYIRNHFGGYWGGDAASAPLLHTWSLAVEEQFYLIYPLMLALCIRLGKDKLLVLTGAIAVGSLAACLWSTWHDPQGANYLPHTRMWELLCGALLSMVRNRSDSVRARLDGKADVLGILGLALIAAGFIGISEASRLKVAAGSVIILNT